MSRHTETVNRFGKFFGVMEALKIIDLNAYVDIGKSATGRCDDILHFTSQIEK